MMEILKQGVYAPVSVAKQVCALYAWGNGFFDEIDVTKIGKLESDFYASLEEEKSILNSIETEKVMNDEIETKLKWIIEKVVQLYK
jgi:F-type H+-transporting ATPase subunit alpha